MNNNDHNKSHSTPPIPVRFWWLKRITVVVAILIIILGGLRWWWGVKAHQALQAEIDRIKATGQPLYPEDFDSPPVPDDQNAALLYNKAVDTFNLTDKQTSLIRDLCKNPQDLNKHSKEINEMIDATTEARKLVRKARSLSASDWNVAPPSWRMLLPSFSSHIRLVRLLNIIALDQHNQGNDAAAIEIYQDILAYGRHTESTHNLIATLVDCAYSRLIIPSIQDISQTLVITDKTTKSPSRTQVQSLINDLLNEKDLREGLVWSFYHERTTAFEAVRRATSKHTGWKFFAPPTPVSHSWDHPLHFIIKPTYELDGVKILQRSTVYIEAASAPNWSEVCKHLPPPFIRQRGLKGSSRFLSSIFMSDLTRALKLTFEQLAQRRMAAVALALRLYELDHNQLPEKLEDLVPQYLPAVPEDPFSENGQTIQYQPDPNKPILRSIGPQDEDDPTKTETISFPLKNLPDN